MGSLGWKWRRLRAMSAQEVATRLVRAVRERVSPLPKEPPDATWRRHYAAHVPVACLYSTHSKTWRLSLRQNNTKPSGQNSFGGIIASMSAMRFRVLFAIVLLIALMLRMGVVMIVHPGSEQYDRLYLTYDARGYHDLAVIFQKDGITKEFMDKVAIVAPGYPLLLGVIYRLFGVNLTPPLIANVILSVLTCAIVMLLTRRAFGEPASIVAGLLFALHPHSIRFTAILYSETLFMFITSVFIFSLLNIHELNKMWWLRLAGVAAIAALGAFSRISMLYFSVLAVLVWLLCNNTGWRLKAQRFALFVALYLTFLSPWMIYNKIHHDTFKLSISGEYNLLALVVASARADDIDTFHKVKNELINSAYERAKQDGVEDVFKTSPYFLDRAIEEINKDVGRFIWSQIKGVFNFWFRPVQAQSSRASELVQSGRGIVYYIYYSYVSQLILFLAWIALFFDKGKIPTPWKVLSVVAVIYFAFTVGNAAYSRFFLHALPYIIPIAAASLVSFQDRISRLIAKK
jgi:4-amino-4-deoxy-L-arabinose transferase-like glycosyltransferase